MKLLTLGVTFILGLFYLAACASQGPAAPVTIKGPAAPVTITSPNTITDPNAPGIFGRDPSRWLTPTHMRGSEPVRVGLLLPLGAESNDVRNLAQSLLEAAQLALFDQNNNSLLLIPKDTFGMPEGAAAAAQEVIDQGAELILGPLFAPSVQAIAPIARMQNVPIVAFSTDREVAGDGVYLLSFMPENEIDTVARYAASQGLFRFAALIPYGPYGARVQGAFSESVMKTGGIVTQIENYARETAATFEPVKRLANYNVRLAALQLERQRLRENDDEASRQALERLEDVEVWSSADYQAVLIPEEGNLLRSLAPLLAYYEVDPRTVKFLGTGLWDDPEIVREPSLLGGWFAAPPPDTHQAFLQNFAQAYGRTPPRIASLAYDALMLAATLSESPRGARFSQADITNPNGFLGIDGLFRLLPDGRSERGLAVLEVTPNGFKVINAAPNTFEFQS